MISTHRRRTMTLALMLALMLGILAGCGSVRSISGEKRAVSLEASAETYRKLIRWGYYDEAAKYVRARDGSQADADLARTARYRVTRYDIGDILLADTSVEGRVSALIEYYEIDSGVLDTIRDDQYWWYDEEGKRWYLGSGLPAFGRE